MTLYGVHVRYLLIHPDGRQEAMVATVYEEYPDQGALFAGLDGIFDAVEQWHRRDDLTDRCDLLFTHATASECVPHSVHVGEESRTKIRTPTRH